MPKNNSKKRKSKVSENPLARNKLSWVWFAAFVAAILLTLSIVSNWYDFQQMTRTLWDWLSISKNQSTLTFIGTPIAVLAAATWVVYVHFSSKKEPQVSQVQKVKDTDVKENNTISQKLGITRKTTLKESVRNFSNDLEGVFGRKKFVVFLCGPTLKNAATDKAAALRLRFKEKLEDEGFDIVLGEDDGLEDLRKKYDGMAHDNELQFIRGYSNTVLLIASSVGSFCELGLFSYQHVQDNERGTDFILILDEKYKDDVSYLNEGPAEAIRNYGELIHGNFDSFDIEPVVKRLKKWRNVWFTGKRGRPVGS